VVRTNLGLQSLSLITTLFTVSTSFAQMDMAFRRNNAVVLYEFAETSGNQVLDTSKIGAPLNLVIGDASGAAIERGKDSSNGLNYINILTRNLIQSTAAATKIIDACKASGEMSVEVWVENNDPAEPLTGEYPAKTPQPNRIISLSTNLMQSNFYIGQFYKEGELYYSAVNTSGNETPGVNRITAGGNLNNPIISPQKQVIIPQKELDPPTVSMQKIVLTLTKERVARLYVSDREGNLSRVSQTANGFGIEGNKGLFDDWYPDAKLTLGNVASTFEEVKNARGIFKTCVDKEVAKDASCGARSRYWKGKIYLAAVYCKALSDRDLVGDKADAGALNPIIDIDLDTVINDQRKRAQDIFQRLTGVKTPIYDPILSKMVQKLDANDPIGAADFATSDNRFYNVTVRDFASKMSNRAETINVPLNDMTATIIGVVRDDLNAQRLLWDNITYVADPTKAAVPSTMASDLLRSNNHYESLDTQRVDLANVLTRFDKNGEPLKQKIFDGKKVQNMPTPAGILTSRAWMSAHAIAGTNRRLVEYSLREFMCTPLENVADSTGPDNVVARDIDRFPGGSHTKFTTTCRACHTIMDGFRPAFAYFTFNSDYVMHSYTSPAVTKQEDEDNGLGMFKTQEAGATYVHKKLNHNDTVFPGGRVTVDDNWINDAIYGANSAYFAWKKTSGKGIQEYGRMLADSRQFPICMAKRVYTQVCKREPASSESEMINAAAKEFSTTRNYSLKFLFQKIVTSKECLGGN
jgi:hypothetical protein